MSAWRCPKCNAAIKLDADWCGQCYADLRPPPPPPLVPVRSPVAGPPAAAPPGEQLFAPYDAAGAAADPLWTDEQPPAPTGWPCTDCGALNDFALSACAACGMPFGAALREPRPQLPGSRRSRTFAAIGIVLLFMGLVALLSR